MNSIFSFEKCIFGKKIWFHEFSRVLRILIKLHSENRIPLTQELEIEARVEVQIFFKVKRSYIFYIILEYLVTIFGIDFANSYFSKRPPPAPPPQALKKFIIFTKEWYIIWFFKMLIKIPLVWTWKWWHGCANHIKPPVVVIIYYAESSSSMEKSTCWMTDNAGHTWWNTGVKSIVTRKDNTYIR